jgi:hypothetical protein
MSRLPVVPGLILASALACSKQEGTPPRKVEPSKAKVDVTDSPSAPEGAVYAIDRACSKCSRVRGEGCVSRVVDSKPLGCGWVAPGGTRAAIAWIERGAEVPKTLWWYGTDGQTQGFWTPCETPQCAASPSIGDDGIAVVTFGESETSQKVRYDVDAGEVVPAER